MIFRSINLSNHTPVLGGSSGPALPTEGRNMKEIIYKGKKVKVPFEDANYTLDGEKDVVLKNRFG